MTETSNLISKLMCGQTMPALNREIELLKVKVTQPKMNAAELDSFSSDFCRDGYRKIMEMQGGSVIWNFIKPILQGKILYTPKAPVTDAIMSNMNTTLRFMPRIVEMLHAWSQTFTSLETFYYDSNVNNRMVHVKHLVESIFINGEADGLFDDIDTFNIIERMTRSGRILSVIKLIGQVAQCASFDKFVGVNDENELEEMARSLTQSHEFIGGIVFIGNEHDYSSMESMRTNIQYKVRIDIDFVPSTKALKARIWEPGPRDNYFKDMGYMHGFVQIQEMVDRAIISYLMNTTNLPIEPQVHLQQQPYLCYNIDKFGNYIRSLAPLITTMAWIFLIAYLIREQVLERELHLEEVMRVMGLKSGVAWVTWFLIGFTVMTFAASCAIFILYIGNLIPTSDPLLLFLFFMAFNLSLIMFCYMISSFFRTATIAALSGIVCYLASFLPFMVAITLENDMNFVHKVISCLSMSTSFCFGMMYMTRFEVQGVGMQWDNLWHSPMQGDTMNTGTAMIMLIVDACLYFLVAWYVSHVSPSGNNAHRYSWLFFLSFSYWRYDFLQSFGFGEEDEPIQVGPVDNSQIVTNHSEPTTNLDDNLSITMDGDTPFNFIDPEDIKSLSERHGWPYSNKDDMITDDHGTLKTISGTLRNRLATQQDVPLKNEDETMSTTSNPVLGMELRGLYVVYNEHSKQSKHVAVSNLNLTLREGQITTVLGRNGAGKTTAINVLTGQLPPTSGTVAIYGHRIPDEFSRARRLLGYCPQYNTLFNNMTVREHLIFFSELKGLLPTKELIDEDVDEILNNMDLTGMQHQLAKHLSGGLKRRLCVALAFVGGSKLIILDEPTASVDPVARRRIWDLIVQQKQYRTVLLTTHHMDEAEILSDEVAFIHKGKLLCTGSPLLLKSKYGCGYQLTVSKQGSSETNYDTLSAHEDIALNTDTSSLGSNHCRTSVDKLMQFVKCLIPNASFVDDNSSEVILSLPQYDDRGVAHDYATFFRCFDLNICHLGFGSYGVTSTTLEEVFLTLCNLEESDMKVDEAKISVARQLSHSHAHVGQPEKGVMIGKSTDLDDNDCTDRGMKLVLRQLYALLSKRALHMSRDWKLLFCTLFLPCIFIAFAMGMTLIKPFFAPDPSLPLLPQIYGESTVSFISNQMDNGHNVALGMVNLIEQELTSSNIQNSHVDCLEPSGNWKTSKCPILHEIKSEQSLPEHLLTLRGKTWTSQRKGSCQCSEQVADIDPSIQSPRNTGYGWVYNLTSGVNVSQFLLRTQPEFMDRRWGGWSFHLDTNHLDHHINQMANRNVVKVWYDNNGFHSMPSYLSSLNNALLRANLKVASKANASRYSITTYSHPLHVRSNQVGDQSVMQQAGDAGIAIIILVGFIFIPTSFVFYIVRERVFEEKHLQRTFGIGPCLYWTSSLLWDVTILCISIGLACAIILMFRLPIYMARLNLPAILALLFFFGWAMINLVYLLEKLFSEPSLAFMILYCLSLFIGIHTMVMRMMIDVFKLVDITPTIYQMFKQVAVLFPPYLLLTGIVDIHRNQLFTDIFTLFDQDAYVNPFSMGLLGRHFTIFALEGIFFFIINLCLECGLLSSVYQKLTKESSKRTIHDDIKSSLDNEDIDVAEERRRVTRSENNGSSSCSSSPSNSSRSQHYFNCPTSTDSGVTGNANNPSSDILRVFNVSKVFESMFGHKRAVNQVTFSVPRGEVS